MSTRERPMGLGTPAKPNRGRSGALSIAVTRRASRPQSAHPSRNPRSHHPMGPSFSVRASPSSRQKNTRSANKPKSLTWIQKLASLFTRRKGARVAAGQKSPSRN